MYISQLLLQFFYKFLKRRGGETIKFAEVPTADYRGTKEDGHFIKTWQLNRTTDEFHEFVLVPYFVRENEFYIRFNRRTLDFAQFESSQIFAQGSCYKISEAKINRIARDKYNAKFGDIKF